MLSALLEIILTIDLQHVVFFLPRKRSFHEIIRALSFRPLYSFGIFWKLSTRSDIWQRQGHTDSQFNLGVCFARGIGICKVQHRQYQIVFLLALSTLPSGHADDPDI